MRSLIIILISVLLLVGCASTESSKKKIGQTEMRRFIILAEHTERNVAQQYANQYNAAVWYSPSHGIIADAIGQMGAIKDLSEELRSINNTSGYWELIISSSAEKFFLATLKSMEDGSLSNARGAVYLVESSGNRSIETEVERVSGGSFAVKYNY